MQFVIVVVVLLLTWLYLGKPSTVAEVKAAVLPEHLLPMRTSADRIFGVVMK